MLNQNQKHFVFVLSSEGKDVYSAMTRIAIASIRHTNPKGRISIVCDAISDSKLQLCKDPIALEVDQWIVKETPKNDAGFRNRFLKTQLRHLIAGPFLFLDSDLLVRGSLDPIFSLDADIAAARNHSKPDISGQIWERDQQTIDRMGWKVDSGVYVNGGVLYYRDTPLAHRLAEVWHTLWLESGNQGYGHRDQPSLNAAIHQVRPRLEVLANRFNHQIVTTPGHVPEAVIWHFYASGVPHPPTDFERLAQKLHSGNLNPREKVKALISNPYPWTSRSFLDKHVIKRTVRANFWNLLDRKFLMRDLAMGEIIPFLKTIVRRGM